MNEKSHSDKNDEDKKRSAHVNVSIAFTAEYLMRRGYMILIINELRGVWYEKKASSLSCVFPRCFATKGHNGAGKELTIHQYRLWVRKTNERPKNAPFAPNIKKYCERSSPKPPRKSNRCVQTGASVPL